MNEVIFTLGLILLAYVGAMSYLLYYWYKDIMRAPKATGVTKVHIKQHITVVMWVGLAELLMLWSTVALAWDIAGGRLWATLSYLYGTQTFLFSIVLGTIANLQVARHIKSVLIRKGKDEV